MFMVIALTLMHCTATWRFAWKFYLNTKINFSLVGLNLILASLFTARELASKFSKQVSKTASKLATFKLFEPLSEVVEYSINIYFQLCVPSVVSI